MYEYAIIISIALFSQFIQENKYIFATTQQTNVFQSI